MFFLFQALVDAKITINCDDNDIYDNHIKTDLQRLVSNPEIVPFEFLIPVYFSAAATWKIENTGFCTRSSFVISSLIRDDSHLRTNSSTESPRLPSLQMLRIRIYKFKIVFCVLKVCRLL